MSLEVTVSYTHLDVYKRQVVLTFFIAGLLYLLRFERVDNLGAYSIPSETCLLYTSRCV